MASQAKTRNNLCPVDVEYHPIWQALQLEINSGYDDATEVLEILQRRGFDEYSDADKLEFLSDTMPVTKETNCESPKTRRVILGGVIMGDNARILAALLPKIPLSFSQLSHAQELPYHEEARQILAANKCSWRSTNVKCQCKSHSKPSSDAEKVCAMTRKASIYLAADLFLRACEHLSGKCILYLLSVCPEILTVSMSADCARFVAKAIKEIPELGNIFLNPQILQMASNNIGAITYWLFYAALTGFTPIKKTVYSYLHVFLTIAGGLFKNDIVRYRDAEGCSLLHLVFNFMVYGNQWQCKYRLGLIRHLLLFGFDPAVTNDAGLTVLDILFQHLCQFDVFFSDIQQVSDDCERNQYIVQTFLLYAHTVLSYFQNEAVRNIGLPQVCFEQSPNFVANFDNIWNVFLDMNLFPQSTLINIGSLLDRGLFMKQRTSTPPCVPCSSVPRLVLREMRKGLDLSAIIADKFDEQRVTFLEFIYTVVEFAYNHGYRLHHLDKFPQEAECCLWRTMELIIHSTASIGRLCHRYLIDDLSHECQDFARCRSKGLSILGGGIVPRVIRMLWMYDPTSKPYAIAFVDRLARSSDAEHQQTAAELQPLVRSVRRLDTLCRIVIVRNIRFVDIPKLPLPPLLLDYLQLGDLSDDHPLKL